MKNELLTHWHSSDKDACKDAALAAILLLTLAVLYYGQIIFVKLAIILILIAMVYPQAFRPFAFVWYAISKVLGMVVPKIVLSVIFGLFVIPVGVLRQLLGKDDLKLKSWKKGNGSVFTTRNQTYVADDLKHPF